jgi:hypothetical protein
MLAGPVYRAGVDEEPLVSSHFAIARLRARLCGRVQEVQTRTPTCRSDLVYLGPAAKPIVSDPAVRLVLDVDGVP